LKHVFRCLILALIGLPEIVSAQTAYARKGIIDLNTWNFQRQGTANLTGEWEFYMSELVPPSEFSAQAKPPQDYIDFPGTWNELSKGLRPGDGYATYRVKVALPAAGTYALELPHFYSNYMLWINSKLIASNGKVGTSEHTSIPQWLPQTVMFKTKADTLDIVIQASNFYHAKGGVREPILLGIPNHLNFKRQVAITSNLVMVCTLIVISVAFLFVFLFSKSDKSVLYFAALCITWAVRSMFSNKYVFNSFVPEFPWEAGVKIEYITLYLTMIWAILFLASLFKNDVNVVFKYLLVVCNVIFISVTLFFKASLYTQFLPVYLSFCVFLLIYIIYILIRAVVYERQGVWLLITCVFLGVILFSYDLVAYEGFATFNPIIINFGYFLMFMLMGLCLLYQLGLLKPSSHNANMLTYEDLYGAPKESKR
jgi:hypothetical protein